jgi:Tfp pilus assembly ATPase PilU
VNNQAMTPGMIKDTLTCLLSAKSKKKNSSKNLELTFAISRKDIGYRFSQRFKQRGEAWYGSSS